VPPKIETHVPLNIGNHVPLNIGTPGQFKFVVPGPSDTTFLTFSTSDRVSETPGVLAVEPHLFNIFDRSQKWTLLSAIIHEGVGNQHAGQFPC
jgi:hypothetical protein